MARIIAEALDGDLDVVLVRKLRAPGQPGFAIGAVDEQGQVLKGAHFELVSESYVREETRAQREILRQRRRSIPRRSPARPRGAGRHHRRRRHRDRVVDVVGDPIGQGAGREADRRRHRGGSGTLRRSDRRRSRRGRGLHAADDFYAVGQFFDDFSEVSDTDVVIALERGSAYTPVHGDSRR